MVLVIVMMWHPEFSTTRENFIWRTCPVLCFVRFCLTWSRYFFGVGRLLQNDVHGVNVEIVPTAHSSCQNESVFLSPLTNPGSVCSSASHLLVCGKNLLKRVSSLQDPNEIVDHLGDTLLITSVEQPSWCFTHLYQLWWPCSRLCKGYKNVGKVKLKTVFAGQWLSLSDRFWTLHYCCMHTQDALAPHMAFCNFSVRVEGKS